MPVGSVTLDIGKMEAVIVQAAMAGGNKAAEEALRRVQRRAPVRRVFKGTRFRKGVNVMGRNSASRPSWGVMGFGGVQPKIRQVRISSEPGEQRVLTRGHPNAMVPLITMKTPSGGTAYARGYFRTIDPNTGRLAKVLPTAQFYRPAGGKLQRVERRPISMENRLTTEGRYEVKTGRANFRNPETGRTTVGGRLRGELHIEGPFKGDTIWWYIVSRTKDRGRLYGRDMEFGNAHNRAFPFMRPGLHESRDSFRVAVKSSLREATRKR